MSKNIGVFSKNDLVKMVENGRLIPCVGFDMDHINTASVDLTSTGEAYTLKTLLQPSQIQDETVRELLPFMEATRIELGAVLDVGSTTITKASLEVNFPPSVYGYLNAKSSSGRCFVFARSLADRQNMFDSADRRRNGYSGELWIVIQPLAFPIVFTNKERYDQLRIFNGDTRFKQKDLDDLLLDHDLLYRRETQEPYKHSELSLFTDDGSILCTLHAPVNKIIGYRCKKGSLAVDLTKRNLDPKDYFEPVYAEEKIINGKTISFVKVEGGYYYLLSTNEILKVPDTHTAELVALDTRLGFFFSHFAGFFDNGFFGTATLEIFSPFTIWLRHKQPVARFVFEKLRSKAPSYKEKGTYQSQIETQLPKQFLSWK